MRHINFSQPFLYAGKTRVELGKTAGKNARAQVRGLLRDIYFLISQQSRNIKSRKRFSNSGLFTLCNVVHPFGNLSLTADTQLYRGKQIDKGRPVGRPKAGKKNRCTMADGLTFQGTGKVW